MKKCVEFKSVSREDGSTIQRCARFDESSDVAMIPAGNGNNTGLVVPEAISGLGMIEMDDLVGPGVGMTATAIGTVLAAKYGDRLHWAIPKYSGVFGAIFGALCSIPLYYAKDTKTMISGVVSSVALGTALEVIPRLTGMSLAGCCDYAGLTIQPVGALPQVHDAGNAPSGVWHQADLSAYGQVV